VNFIYQKVCFGGWSLNNDEKNTAWNKKRALGALFL